MQPSGPSGRSLSRFLSLKRLRVFLTHRLECQSIAGHPAALHSPVPIYTPGWREALLELSVLPENTRQRPRPGLEPGPLDPETSALNNREKVRKITRAMPRDYLALWNQKPIEQQDVLTSLTIDQDFPGKASHYNTFSISLWHWRERH